MFDIVNLVGSISRLPLRGERLLATAFFAAFPIIAMVSCATAVMVSGGFSVAAIVGGLAVLMFALVVAWRVVYALGLIVAIVMLAPIALIVMAIFNGQL